MRNQTLIVGIILQFLIHFLIVLHPGGQNRHLGILPNRIVSRDTPDYLDIRIQTVEELIYLLHLRHHDGSLLARIDIKENPLRLADVAAVEQRRVQRILDGPLHASFAAGPSHRHDCTAAVAHGRFHIPEVKVNPPVAVHRDQFRDSYHGILQDIVSPCKRILHRDRRVGIHVAKPLIIDNQNGIHVLPHLIHPLQRPDNLLLLFKAEGNRHDTNRQQPHLAGHARHHWSRPRARSAAHAGSDEHHLRAVAQQMLNVSDILFRL